MAQSGGTEPPARLAPVGSDPLSSARNPAELINRNRGDMPAQAGQHVIRPVVRPGGRNHSDAKCNLEVVRSDYHSLAMDICPCVSPIGLPQPVYGQGSYGVLKFTRRFSTSRKLMRATWLSLSVLTLVLVVPLSSQVVIPGPAVSAQRAVLDKYCVSCHNERLKTANLMLDKLNLAALGGHAAEAEKVVRKLRAGMMPPQGMPRPDAATREALIDWLENE